MKKVAIYILFYSYLLSQDSTPLEIQSLSFNPLTINTSESEATSIATIRVTDDLSGIYSLNLEFKSTNGTDKQFYWSAGTQTGITDTTLQIEMTWPQYSEAGDWNLYRIATKDITKNFLRVYQSDLDAKGFDTKIVNDYNSPILRKVPSAYSTIQAALNAAKTGDTVLVAVGTYNENIIWPDVNGIRLISAGDSSDTIIDGGNNSSVIYVNSTNAVTIDTSALIKGFKIQNGGGVDYGGGIYIKKSGLKIEKCSIEKNIGGIFIEDSSQVYIYNSSISENSGNAAALFLKIGIICEIHNSLIANNSGPYGGIHRYGGGIRNDAASLLIKSSTITNNKSSTVDAQGGGGLFFNGGTTKIYDSKFSKNESSYGGGITVAKGNLLLNNVELLYNTATKTGGGLYIEGSGIDSIIMDTVLIFNNNAKYYAGGLAIQYAHLIGKFETNNVKIISNTSDASAGLWLGYANDDFSLSGITLAYNKGSTIVGHFSYGSNKYNLSKSSIYNNENTDYAINAMGGSIIDKSNFFGNKRALYNSVGPSMITAENNYWGDSSGPYHPSQNTSGSGDSTSSIVDVDPWLTTPYTDAPPIPAQNLTLTASAATSASFSWDASKMGDIAGYKFYYDTDSSGYPYANSVDLGNVITKSLTGLTTGKTYYVAVTTYDTDGNESWYSKEVAVQLNNPPVIAAVSDVTINEDKTSTVTLSATDADGDAITYSAVSDTNAVTISVSSTKLTLTPNANWHGVATIKAYASDGYSKDSTSFKLTVTPVNDAPIISAVPDNSTNEETEKAIVVGASDVDGDALTYTASSDTSAVSITVSSDTLKLTPATNYTGTAKITVVVSDNALKDTTSFNFKVININDSPVISTLSDVTINEDETGSVSLSATDIDGDAITYSAVSDTNAVTTSVSSSTLTLTPNSNWHGVANIKAYASDGSAKDSTTFKLTVTSVNDAPTLTAITETLSTDEETVLKVAFKGEDVDSDDLTYAYASDTSGVAATHNTAKDSLVLTPVTDFFGNAIITVTVSDGSLSDTSSFTLNVININDAPVLSGIQNQNINEDEVIVVKLTATDLDGDALSYSGIADTSAVTVTASNDTLKLTPKADWNGTSVITAIASDGTISDSTSFTLNVNPVQDVPYAFDWVSPNERDTINVDKNNTATEYVFKWNSSKDVDGDALTYHFYVADTLIEVLSDTTTVGTYQDFLDHWPLQFQMLPRMTFTFNVWVHDGTDSVKVTGEPRKVLVNRYENLSTEGEGVPVEFALHENYPNPFNPTTTLRFDLPEVSNLTLTIYNMLGQKVRTFNYQNTSAGYHSVKWNATNDYGDPVGAGVYLYQLQTKDFVKTRKMVLLK